MKGIRQNAHEYSLSRLKKHTKTKHFSNDGSSIDFLFCSKTKSFVTLKLEVHNNQNLTRTTKRLGD